MDPTRTAAFLLIADVLDRGRTLDDALASLPAMDSRDRAAGHRLAATVLRWPGTLDAILEPFLHRAPPPPVRHILRLGAAGLMLLQTPPHAAVATAVALARQRKLEKFTGLINAVLRRVAEQATLEGLDSPRLDTPPWLWTSWSSLGGNYARAIAEAHHKEAALDLTLAPGAEPPPGGVMLPNGSVRFPPGTSVTGLAGYADGKFWVQDAAATLPARLLAPSAGERIADLCAAPGGKTAQLIAAGARVTAVDHDPARVARLEENLARLRMRATCVTADAAQWSPAEAGFDAVLLDAPCSATGTIRRHPDLPHLRRPADIAPITSLQDRLLAAAARLLRPGGRLIYAVCSLQPEEAEPRLDNLPGMRPQPFTKDEIPFLPEALTASGHLRTHPGLWPEYGGMDGFFIARLARA
jgi:16S rRNA (cytosine967-C5)-methyltransferase